MHNFSRGVGVSSLAFGIILIGFIIGTALG